MFLVRVLPADNSDVKELNSQPFLAAAHNHEFVANPNNSDNQLTVSDGDQEVTGEIKGSQKFVYCYPQNYDIAAALNQTVIPFITDPQNTGFWLTLLGTLGLILLIILFMSSM